MSIEFTAAEIRDKVREEIALELTDDQAERLARFATLLLKWNKTYNLTSIKSAEDVVRLHIADSLTLVQHFDEMVGAVKTVLDVGSGGGLPAIPLAIMRPDLSVTLVDAVQKKTIFQRQACVACRLSNAKALHVRVETLGDQKYEVITCRAFASLKDMIELTRGLLAENGRWLAMKGKIPDDEIAELPDDVEIEKELPLTLENGKIDRVLIVLKPKKIGRTVV